MNIQPTQLTPKAISEHFQKHFFEASNHSTLDNSYQSHLYFVSARFEQSGYRFSGPNQLEGFGKLHFKLSRRLLGAHLNRKRNLQPLCYAFVDAEGSRNGNSDVFNCEMPHVHSVILAPPQYQAEFNEAIYDPSLVAAIQQIKMIDVQPYLAERGSVEKLISYCMKGYKQAAPSHFQREDLWTVFPR